MYLPGGAHQLQMNHSEIRGANCLYLPVLCDIILLYVYWILHKNYKYL